MVAFAVTVGVYDSYGVDIETQRGPYAISLALSPTGSMFGSTSLKTASGVAIFSGLRILSAGTFAIVASASGITSATSVQTSVANFVYSIVIQIGSSQLTANFEFQVTVRIKGEDGNLFLGSSSVVITEGSGVVFTGSGQQTTNTGIAEFLIVFGTYGNLNLVATCSTITQSLPITILEEQLTISAISPTVKDI